MPRPPQEFLADAVLPDPKTLQSQQSPGHKINPDPLIAQGWEGTVYIGSALLIAGIVAIVGFVSRRIEHVIVLALILSLGLISLFLFVGH